MAKSDLKLEKKAFFLVMFAFLVAFCFLFTGEVQASPLATDSGGEGDLGSSWLAFLFSGSTSSDPGQEALGALSIALRSALQAYGLSMFVIGGFLLLWQIVSLITETAQSGVVMGRRANQFWTPIRFLIGIALLVPFTSGLTLGQHAVVGLASSGSETASKMWRGAVEIVGESLAKPLMPHAPDVGRVVTTAMEMELCRSMYQQTFAAFQPDSVITFGGSMEAFRKEPAGRLVDETWRYTNNFFPNVGLCGAYSFLSLEGADEGTNSVPSGDEKYAAIAAEASRAVAERLAYQSQSLAGQAAKIFLTNNASTDAEPDSIRGSLSSYIKEQTQLIMAKQAQINKDFGHNKLEAVLARSAGQGWLVAGALPFTLSKEQTALGEVGEYILPRAKAPLLGHSVLNQKAWVLSAQDTLYVGTLQYDRYSAMYIRLNDGMRRARSWLYGSQVDEMLPILPDQQDLRDIMGVYADGQDARMALGHLVRTGASSYGVFDQGTDQAGNVKNTQTSDGSVLPDKAFVAQPLQTIAEMGRRYMGYGSWLLGMLSPAIAEPATMASAVGFMLVAAVYWLAGAVLLFVIPLLPLVRFVVAAIIWGVSVLGAVLSLPLVALGHLYPAGDGLVGPLVRRAYWLWLGLFLRPALILFGFLGGLALFVVGVLLVHVLVFDWMSSLFVVQSQAFWGLRSAISLIYVALLLILSNVAFRGISFFPGLLDQWVNTQGALPETLAVNLPATPSGAANQSSFATMIEKGSVVASGVISNAMHPSMDHPMRGRHPKAKEVAERQAHEAQFPHIPELKAEERVHARAEAYAQVDINQVTGDSATPASISVAAMSSASPEEKKAMAIARHMAPDMDKGAKGKGQLGAAQMLSPDDDKLTKALKKAEKNDEVKTQESVEQTAAPVGGENNPFKSSTIKPQDKN